jgi:hypothetical protein
MGRDRDDDGPEPGMMSLEPKCGQLRQEKICQRRWFHEGAHLADDGTQWGADESDDLGWTAQQGITRRLTPREYFDHIRGEVPPDDEERT